MSAEPLSSDPAAASDDKPFRLPRLVAAMISLSLLIGAVSAWLTRAEMNPDGISYLDLSDRWMAGDFRGVVNAYWSPLYPALLAVVRRTRRTDSHFRSSASLSPPRAF